VRGELGKFDEGEVQALYDFFAVLVMHNLVVVDEAVWHIVLKDVIDEVQGINWSEFTVTFLLLCLSDIEFGGIEEDTLLEGRGPFHLHLHAKHSAIDVLAQDVHDGVLVLVKLGHEFVLQILDALYLLAVIEWE